MIINRSFVLFSYHLRSIIKKSTFRYKSTMSPQLAAVCQMTSTGNREQNFQTVSDLVCRAKEQRASIAFLPEACDYLADNVKDIIALAEPLDGDLMQRYKNLAKQHDIWLSLGGIHEKTSKEAEKTSNTHVLVDNHGETVGVYRKLHLFDMENPETGVRLMESDYVNKGMDIVPPISTPIGSLGLSICYDVRFAELSTTLRNMGAEILTYPSAFTYQTGAAHWEVLLRARAIETQCYVIAAAQTGTHNKKRTSWGHAMIVDPWGTVVARCSDKTGIAVAEIDLELLKKVRTNMPCENHRRIDLYPEMKPMNKTCT